LRNVKEKKLRNNMRLRRGQEGFSFGSLLGLIIGVVALVLIAIFIYRGFDTASSAIKLLPEEKVAAAKVCELSGSLGDIGWCNDFKEIDVSGRKMYANCDWIADQFEERPDWAIGKDDCTEKSSTMKCWDLREAAGVSFDAEKVFVNGDTCESREVYPTCEKTDGSEAVGVDNCYCGLAAENEDGLKEAVNCEKGNTCIVTDGIADC
jgi:hypothetical protein